MTEYNFAVDSPMGIEKSISHAVRHGSNLIPVAESFMGIGMNSDDSWRLAYTLASHGSTPATAKPRRRLKEEARMVPLKARSQRMGSTLRREFPSLPKSHIGVVKQFILAKAG